MKNSPVLVALIGGASLIIVALIVSSAIKSYGRSLERAASNGAYKWSIPSSFTVDLRLSDAGRPLRVDVSTKPGQ